MPQHLDASTIPGTFGDFPHFAFTTCSGHAAAHADALPVRRRQQIVLHRHKAPQPHLCGAGRAQQVRDGRTLRRNAPHRQPHGFACQRNAPIGRAAETPDAIVLFSMRPATGEILTKS